MKMVVVESPFAGDLARNLNYLRRCLADCLKRGEAPIASHGLLTQPGVLDDHNPLERELGIRAGLAWHARADLVVFYDDLGWSSGMLRALALCREQGIQYEVRWLNPTDQLHRVPND